MAISVEYFVFNNRTFKPDNISFGEGETLEIKINGGASGKVTTVPLAMRTATLTVEGATSIDLTSVQDERDNNIRDLIRQRAVLQDLDFGGYVVEQALLLKFTPSAPIKVDGVTIYETIELEYQSQVYA
jgi:hypothetical protein